MLISNQLLFPNTSFFVLELWSYYSNKLKYFISFRFLFVSSISFDISSLNFILLSVAHYAILFSSMLAKFSASPIDSASTINTKTSAKAKLFVCFVYLRVRVVLYLMFHSPGPQHDPCGHPLVMWFSILMLFIFITAFLSFW